MAGTWRERLHRWRWWLVAATVLLVVRAALPEILRRVIVSQASQALNARVDVGDVDLTLWRGGVALEDVAVRAKDAPEPPPPPKDVPKDAPPPPAFDAYSPIVGFKRFAVELRYWPLVHKIIQLRDIALDSPRVSLDRLASGDLNVMALVPKQEVAVEAGGTPGAAATATAAAAAAAPAGTPWSFGLDKFILTDGRVRFRDLALEGSEPVELGIDRISVDQVALTPSVYGKPATIAIKLGVDEGTIDLKANLTLDGSKVSVTTDVTAANLPLRRARLYVPKVGWSDLKGELDLGLTYELVPDQTNALHGTIGLRNVSVAVPSLTDVALGWKSLAVSLERIDLIAQRAAVESVALDGASLAVHLEGGDLLPALAPKSSAAASPSASPSETAEESTPNESTPAEGTPAATPAESAALESPVASATVADTAAPNATVPVEVSSPTPASAEATPAGDSGGPSPTPSTTPAEGTPAEGAPAEGTPAEGTPAEGTPTAVASPSAEPSPPPKPWGWQVGSVKITDSKIDVLSDTLPPLSTGITLDAATLSGDADAVGHVALGLAIGPGSIALDGNLRIAPSPAFGGTLKITELPLPMLPVVRRVLPPEAMSSGNLRTDLTISAGLPAAGGEAAADRLHVAGTVGVAALHLTPPQAPGLTVDLADVELKLDKLSVPGVIPPGAKAPAGAAIDLAAGLNVREPHVVRTGEQPLDVAMQSITLAIPSLTVPAALAKLGPGEPLVQLNGELGLDLEAPKVAMGEAMTFEAGHVGLKTTLLAKLGASEPLALLDGELGLDLEAPKVAMGEAMAFEAGHVGLKTTQVKLPLLMPPPSSPAAATKAEPTPEGEVAAQPTPEGAPTAAAAAEPAVVPAAAIGAPPTTLDLQLDLATPKVTMAQGKELDASAQAIALQVTGLVVPGFVAGAPLAPSAEPLQAKGSLTLTQPRVVRGDGKEFAVSAKSISVPLQSLSLPGVPGGVPPGAAAQPLKASFDEIRLESPAIRLTRTKDGIILPASGSPPAGATPAAKASPVPAAPPVAPPSASPSPTAGPPMNVQIAALRVLRGGLEFTDRAVQPPAEIRFAPIEIDARNVTLPGPKVKPLKVDITSLEQGRISVRGDLGSDESTMELKIEELALAPFNSYAITYSPYGIGDGALTLDVKADAKGGKYEITNDIRLHQFDLSGSEGDSLFEQNFGVPLSLALALLRDIQGNIDLSVPMQLDSAGNAQIDLVSVVRSALKQALAGAITSPLKMLGAVAGGSGAPIAPQPIAFRIGRAEATSAGAESATRLATFLTSRPAMGVELTCVATADDARWLHEHALLASWSEEGFFERSLAFVTERGPRERIRGYLEARVADQKPELSAEDAATLDEWLKEIPPPTAAELQALADARLGAVESVLRDKGIDAARISRGETPADTGKPIVGIHLRSAAAAAAADPAP